VSDRAATAVLLAGYAAAIPFTVFVPGFLRLWRRRETWTYASAQGGALLVAAGWAAKGSVPAAAANVLWLLGLGLAYTLEGRRRSRT
jgi:hypothetical protein